MHDRQVLIDTSSYNAGFISARELMGRHIARTFGLSGRMVTGIKPHRSGSRHRGTRKWDSRYHLKETRHG